MEHPVITQINRYGYPLDNLPQTFYCDCCGDEVAGEVFEYDGYIYCGIRCLTQSTDINYGDVYEFKSIDK